MNIDFCKNNILKVIELNINLKCLLLILNYCLFIMLKYFWILKIMLDLFEINIGLLKKIIIKMFKKNCLWVKLFIRGIIYMIKLV